MRLTEAKALAGRLKRGMRHPEVLSLCEFVLGHFCGSDGVVLRSAEESAEALRAFDETLRGGESAVARDVAREMEAGRKAYMREYMRMRRAKKQTENKAD